MMTTFAIPDIHGRLDLLRLAMTKIAEEAGETPHRVVFLGDYIDRGPQSAQVVRCIREGIDAGKPWVALKGNHEDFMVGSLVEGDRMFSDSWMQNGGMETIASYGDDGAAANDDAAWMAALPAYFEDAHRVYVHAWVPEAGSLADTPEHALMWTRYEKGADMGHGDKHVVHGHTPMKNGPELFTRRTNLDCGAVFCGRLVVGVFDDAVAGGPVKLIEVHA